MKTAALMVSWLVLLGLGAASTAHAEMCVGDCNRDGRVTINELIVGVNIALGDAALDVCPAFDTDESGTVKINELIAAVGRALNGCPAIVRTATATPAPTLMFTQGTPLPTATTTPLGPTIASVAPATACPGTLVTISGQRFSPLNGGVPAVGLNKQGGGSIDAPIARFTDTSIDLTTPTGATTGPVSVTVNGSTVMSSQPLVITACSSFQLDAAPRAGHVMPGYTTSYAIAVQAIGGFSQLAALTVSGLPPGVSASFKPALVGAGGVSVLTVQARGDALLGQSALAVTAQAKVNGLDVSATANVSLTVDPVSTSFMGRTVVDDATHTPLGGVTVTFVGVDGQGKLTGCTGSVVSDAAGNFAFTNLPAACLGPQLVRYDGLTATNPPGQFAGVDLVYNIFLNRVTVPPVPIHLPRIDDKETVLVQQNAPVDQTFTFRTIPGLSVTVYAGTIFTLADGSQPPDVFPLTAVQVPVDRLPDQVESGNPQDPQRIIGFIVAFQPANATASQPVAVYFPNTLNKPPGTKDIVLMTLEPTRGLMVPYGTGTISDDGSQTVPDFDPDHPGKRYGLVHFDWHCDAVRPPPSVNPGPPGSGVCPIPPNGKPVDPASGLEVLTETDLAISSLRGSISIQRVYRSLSAEVGPFGIGTGHNYSYRLDTGSPQSAPQVNLILPDGSRIPFRQPTGFVVPANSIVGAKQNDAVPALRGVTFSAAPDGRAQLRFKDGTVFSFIPSGPVSLLDAITDANGNRVSLTRDPNRPIRITQIVDPVGRRLTLTYDSADRITRVTDPIGRTVAYAYNTQGTLESVTDPDQKVTHYEYDSQNRLSKVIDARGITVAEIAYDATTGRAISQKLVGGGVWQFAYTFANPLLPTGPVLATQVTDPLGNVTSYRFNPQGFLIDVTDAQGQTRVFNRESGTNLLLSITGTASCGACGSPSPGDQFFTYDANGNLASLTDALGNSTSFTYEPTFNKVASIIDPLQHTTAFTYGAGGNLRSVTDANQHTTTFAYDGSGQLTSITDPLSHQTQIAYDAFGNPVAIIDALGNTTHLAYDGVSHLTQVTDALGRSTRVVYDGLDRVTQVIDALGNSTQAGYDAIGELLSVTDVRGNTTSFTYDPVARENTRTDSLGKTDYRRYDPAGNLVEFIDRRGLSSQFVYDVLNRLMQETYADAEVTRSYDQLALLAHVTDSQGGDFSFTHDLAGRLLSSVGPFGTITYLRDALGRVKQRQVVGQSPVTYQYDPVGNLTLAAMPDASVAMTYDSRNQLGTEERSNGVGTEYDYDSASRLTQLIYRNSSGVLGNLTYGYDAAGNRRQVGGSFARTLLPDPVAATSTSYDAANRQRQFGNQAMNFDEDGNLTTIMDFTGMTKLSWDARNRLSAFAGPSATASFTYDALGRRLQKSVNGQATQFLYDALDIVQTISAGTPVNFLQGAHVDEPLVRGGNEYYLADALGSVVALTDSTGTVRDQYTYGPYGQTQVTGSSGNPSRFTGREADETDLYYYRARYYSPNLQRFVAEDPLGVLSGDLNLYRYVRNSPINLNDPYGLQSNATLQEVESCTKLCSEKFFGAFKAFDNLRTVRDVNKNITLQRIISIFLKIGGKSITVKVIEYSIITIDLPELFFGVLGGLATDNAIETYCLAQCANIEGGRGCPATPPCCESGMSIGGCVPCS